MIVASTICSMARPTGRPSKEGMNKRKTKRQSTLRTASGSICKVVRILSPSTSTTTSVGDISKLNTGAISKPAPNPEKPLMALPTKVAPASTANMGSEGRCCNAQSGITLLYLALHAPAPNRALFQRVEYDVLDKQADEYHHEQSCKDTGYFKHVLVLIDKPAQAPRAGTDSKNELRGNQGSPGKCPTDLQSGQDACKGRRNKY